MFCHDSRLFELSDEEKLNILRRVDEFRQWDQQNKT
jgi:hypothetical protein